MFKILTFGRNGDKGVIYPRMTKECEHNPRSRKIHVCLKTSSMEDAVGDIEVKVRSWEPPNGC